MPGVRPVRGLGLAKVHARGRWRWRHHFLVGDRNLETSIDRSGFGAQRAIERDLLNPRRVRLVLRHGTFMPVRPATVLRPGHIQPSLLAKELFWPRTLVSRFVRAEKTRRARARVDPRGCERESAFRSPQTEAAVPAANETPRRQGF